MKSLRVSSAPRGNVAASVLSKRLHHLAGAQAHHVVTSQTLHCRTAPAHGGPVERITQPQLAIGRDHAIAVVGPGDLSFDDLFSIDREPVEVA